MIKFLSHIMSQRGRDVSLDNVDALHIHILL